MCPYTSFPPGEGPDRFSPSSVKEWQPRRKSVNNACERCRRRKIRCDGDTPCATCSRFSLQCVRAQKPREVLASSVTSRSDSDRAPSWLDLTNPQPREHQQALEGRIHQLEAQLAAHVSAPMHGMEGIDRSLMGNASSFDWHSPAPHLMVNTGLATQYSGTTDADVAQFSAGSVPSIAILQPESSPVPSFWSGTTRASSPERQLTSAPQLPHNLVLASSSRPSPSPMGLHGAASWDFTENSIPLRTSTPKSGTKHLSRRSSVSSISIQSEEAASLFVDEAESDVDIRPLAPAPRLPRQGVFSAHAQTASPGPSRAGFSDRSRAIGVIPFPSRFEAETLTAEFVEYLESLGDSKPYTLSPAIFARFCETVYPDPHNGPTSVDTSFSVAMARFHVFLAMAIGMKVRIKDSAEVTNALLDRCYELAMQQASTSVFWQEPGGIEASQLLSILGSLRKETTPEPRPLQASFSW